MNIQSLASEVTTKLPPALALGLNRWNAPACAKAVPLARREFRK